jgi:DNA polymerase/3'-5' exonuclease PolX
MKKKFDAEEAVPVAQELVALLQPFCERIEIAGSLRRCKQTVGDIELLFVPRMDERQADMFSTEPVDLAAEKINALLAAGVLAKRPSETGAFTWGRLNKLAVHVASGIPVDFFCEPDAADWPRSIAIRTGPKEFNLRLMTEAPKHGHKAHAYGEALHKIPSGERVIVQTEQEFIELCGVEYVDPPSRR